MKSDIELLQEYVQSASEGAFAELVRRNAGFVYACALRVLRNPQHAHDVTQEVFIALSQKATSLQSRNDLLGCDSP